MSQQPVNVPQAEPAVPESQNLTLQLDKERRNVSFDNYDLAVRQLLDMLSSKDINVAPEYQRKFVWEEARQSEFIESVFLGIPIPNLFMATNKDATWEVVDGVQRLSTLINFAGTDSLREGILRSDVPLTLTGLEKLTAFNEKKLSDLPKSVQLAFQNRPLRVTVLNDKSDMNVRFDLFERLNSGGVKLQPQEIRNCVYRGPFNLELKRLAQQEHFRTVVKVSSDDETNGTYEELVLRFFAFLQNYRDFEHSVLDFLNSYMAAANQQMPSPAILAIFGHTFDFLATELPDGIIRAKRITPFNLFEAIAVGTALVVQSSGNPRSGVLAGLLNDEELRQLTSGGTNRKKMVIGRIEFVRDRLS